VADQVPPNPRLLTPGSYLLLFFQRFLNPILTDVSEAGRECRADRIGAESLGHGDDRYRLRGKPCDHGPHLCQTLREGLETHSL
jgi:hypothetical protein